MSVLASTWAWQQQIPPNWKLVLVALADHAHDDGAGAYPSKALLARKTGYSERQVQRILGQMVADGVIRIVREATTTRPTEYALSMRDSFTVRRDKWGDNLTPPPGVSDVSPGETSETDLVSQMSPEPSVEPSREPSTTSSSPAEPATVCGCPQSDDPFDDFWEHYPRKVGKAAARKAFAKALMLVPPDEVVAGAISLAADPNLPSPEFIPHPSTWLNRGGWEDAPYPARVVSKADVERQIFGAKHAERMARFAERDAQILAQRAAASC